MRPLLHATPIRNVEQDWTARAAEIAARPDEWPLPSIQQATTACATYGLNDALQSLPSLTPSGKMTSPQEFILKLQNYFTNASGTDLQQFLAGLEQPGQPPAGDDLTPDGRIKVAMPCKNGTTTPQWCERVAIVLQRANAPIYNLAGSPVYIMDDGKTVYLTPNNFISAAEKYICPCAFRSKEDSTLVYQLMKEPLAKLTLSSMEFLTAIPELVKIHDQITPSLLPNGTYHLNQRSYSRQ